MKDDLHTPRDGGGILRRFVRYTRNFGRDERGGTMIYVALLMPVLLGMGGLAVDVSMWYADRRTTQNFVDAAAVAATLEMRRSGTLTLMTAAATENATLSGYDADGSDTIQIFWPPQTGPFIGNTNYVEARAESAAQSWLGSTIAPRAFNIEARAVAGSQVVEACIFALHPTARAALTVTGGAQVNLGCGVFVNSSDSEALTQNGTSCLTAPVIAVVGGYSGSCLSPTPSADLNAIVDPLSHIEAPIYGGCDVNANMNLSNGDVVDLAPGVYCGNISANGTSVLNLVPNSDDDNVFVFNGMALSIGAQATMTGDEVFIYFTENQDNPNENWTIAGGATVDLSAADTGPWATYLFYHDRNAGDRITHQLTGGANQTIDGIIYAPTMDLHYAGNSSLNGGTSMMIADEISFVGDTTIGGFAGSLIANNDDLYGATLVE